MRVRVEEVAIGTLLAVKAGEIVPIDGTVTSGKCNVDESSLTGESMPVEKDEGANVWAGTANMSGLYILSSCVCNLVPSIQTRPCYLSDSSQSSFLAMLGHVKVSVPLVRRSYCKLSYLFA
jgi:P-type E1-E2 ATPase